MNLSRSFTPRLLAGVSTLTLLAGIVLLASRPAHTAGGPVAVSVANTPLRVPFAPSAHGYSYASQSLTDYADPGSTVYVLVNDSVFSDNASFFVNIVGYCIDVP